MGNLHIFGNDNINRHMCCSSIGISIGNENIIWGWLRYCKVLVIGLLCGFAIILESSLSTIVNIQF